MAALYLRLASGAINRPRSSPQYRALRCGTLRAADSGAQLECSLAVGSGKNRGSYCRRLPVLIRRQITYL